MTAQDTRSRLIELIKAHQLEHGQTKLGIGELSERAGITRQAFNRYYNDLKPYCLGQSIAALVDDDPSFSSSLLNRGAAENEELKNEINSLKKQHVADLKEALTRHITTLMNNDILIAEANEISTLLINQSKHNEMLNQQLTEIKLSQARSAINSSAKALGNKDPREANTRSAQHLLILPVDLSKACETYQKNKDFDAYEDSKDALISENIIKIKKLPNPEKVEIHFFQERYISSFAKFADTLPTTPGFIIAVFQLPLFAQADISLILSELKGFANIEIHVPQSFSDATTAANRKFLFRGIPDEELKDVGNSKLPLLSWGFDKVTTFKVKQT